MVSPGRTLRYEEGETTENNRLILHRSSMRVHLPPTSKRQMTCDFLLFIKIQIRIFRFFIKIPKTDYWIKWSTTELDSLYHIQNQILGYMIRSVSLLRIRKERILPAVTRNNFNTYNLFDQKHITPQRLTSPYVLRTMLGFFSRRSRPISLNFIRLLRVVITPSVVERRKRLEPIGWISGYRPIRSTENYFAQIWNQRIQD